MHPTPSHPSRRMICSIGNAFRDRILRRPISLVAASLLGVTGMRAAVSTQADATPASAQPSIAFDNMRYDFGKLRHDQTVTHRYIVLNTGKAPLHLKEVKPVCGCTSTVVGKMTIAPGETTAIEATFTPEHGFSGAVRKTILVLCDDPSHPKLTLRFAAEVLPDGTEKPYPGP